MIPPQRYAEKRGNCPGDSLSFHFKDTPKYTLNASSTKFNNHRRLRKRRGTREVVGCSNSGTNQRTNNNLAQKREPKKTAGATCEKRAKGRRIVLVEEEARRGDNNPHDVIRTVQCTVNLRNGLLKSTTTQRRDVIVL